MAGDLASLVTGLAAPHPQRQAVSVCGPPPGFSPMFPGPVTIPSLAVHQASCGSIIGAMKPSSIVVLVLVLVAVPTLAWMLGPGATWVLENIDGVTLNNDVPPPATLPSDELTAKDWASAIAAVRGNVLAVATGLAALLAVFYTARNADTARRMFRLGERGHDTDRFSKAVEQLGSDQAPVRLGGLYALEQLAQSNPALRQTVVDVTCAYLRMPWTPPREEDRQQQIRAAQRAARTRSPGRAEAQAVRNPDEEGLVRLTAQSLLADHLRWRKPRWWQRPTAANPRFWPGIRLDLTGATLLNFAFSDCRIDTAVFIGATFTDNAWFDDTTFMDSAWFYNATFVGYAQFDRANFSSIASFSKATFASTASFDEATFADETQFNKAAFTGKASFRRTAFIGDAWFYGVTFVRDARFDQATFTRDSSFSDTQGMLIELTMARVRPDRAHDWPPGWHVETRPDGAVLERYSPPPEDGAKDEQADGEPTSST